MLCCESQKEKGGRVFSGVVKDQQLALDSIVLSTHIPFHSNQLPAQ